MELQEQVALAPYTTFGIGGPARWFVRATSEADVAEAAAWAETRDLPLFVLGGGSNLLVPDEGFAGLVLHVDLRGQIREGGHFDVGAGEPWDNVVDAAIAADCAGIECLAGIPGSTGGTPVQNVGAYGQEVSQTIESVRAFDRRLKTFVELANAQCRFRYRESLFNRDEPGRYIVVGVRFLLQQGGEPQLRYAELKNAFPNERVPNLGDVAAVVRRLRRGKGMLIVEGDADCRSAGSFFKNPVVSQAEAEHVASNASVALGNMPHWLAGADQVKLPAAWLLERAGYVKGFGTGPVGISTKHTLALTNRGGASFADVTALQDEIVAGVEAKFGVRLEREPVVMRVGKA